MDPKPSDSNHPPILPRDRGRSPFFHGRKEIRTTFRRVLYGHRSLNEGTTFLLQGPPGVGKTALIDKLAKDAKESGWQTVHIGTNTLWDIDDLLSRLGKGGRQLTGVSGEIGFADIGHANLSIDIKGAARTIIKILQDQKKPVLLILDEAQALGKEDLVPKEMKPTVGNVLKEIHNGDLGSPVMLLAGGLGTTEAALNTLGLSRIDRSCDIHLGRLDRESTCGVIRDWLMQVGGVEDDPSPWIEAIAEHTYGWPQHIMSYITPAVEYLCSNHHLMTDEGLEFVLEKGTEYCAEYYESRAHDIDKEWREALARAIMDVPIDGATTRIRIIDDLKQSGLTQEEADKLFNQALEQGIIDQRDGGEYGIPIPSMHNWLIDQYAKNKSQDIPQTPKKLPPKLDQLLPPPNKDDPSGVKKDKGDDRGYSKGSSEFSMER